jgi:hypothetical protein
MKSCTLNRLLPTVGVGVLLLVAPDVAYGQSCTQTLSVGANIAGAVATATNNSTICLNNGNYGSVTFSNISRSGFVTLRSTTGRGATISPNVDNSDFIRFSSLTISGSYVTNCAKEIQFLNSTFSDALSVNNRDYVCTNYPVNFLIDGNTFGNIGPGISEGRLDVRDRESGSPNGAMGGVISNNTFGPGCQSDGIQFTGRVDGVTIGPGNVFDGIVQSGPTHCDMIQFYGGGQNNVITGNWFRNGSVVLTHHTSTPANTQFTNNIISNVQQMQVDQSTNFLFQHNTVYNLTDFFALRSTGGIVRSNILLGSTTGPSTTGSTVSYQLCQSSGYCSGTNQIVGTPTFLGGLPGSISAFAGWQLANGSPGENAGHDGLDRGTLYYGEGATPPPPSTTPTISITSPTSLTTHDTVGVSVSVAGTCTDDGTVTKVTWVNDQGGSGTATGTTSWSISSIGLVTGAVNVVTVTCTDNDTNTGTDTLSILRVAVPATPTDAFTRPAWATLGANWTNQTAVILTGSANQAVANSATTRQCAFWDAHSFTADHYSQVTIVGAPTATRINYAVVRAQGAGAGVYDHYHVTAEGTSSIIGKVINETRTELQTITNVPWASGDTIRLEAVGQTLRAYRNGVQIGSDQPSGGELTAGSAGVCGFGSAAFDNFVGGAVVAPPAAPSPPGNLRVTP